MAGRPIVPPTLVLTGKIWQIKFYDSERQHQRFQTTGTEVYEEALVFFGHWITGNSTTPAGKENATFRVMAEYWLKHHLPTIVAQQKYRIVVRTLIAGLGDETCSTLRRQSVGKRYSDARLSHPDEDGSISHTVGNYTFRCQSTNTVICELRMAQTICKFWITEHELNIAPPIMWKPASKDPKKRAFTPEEQATLRRLAARFVKGRLDRLARWLEIALAGGGRATCIEALEYGFNVDLARGKIDFRTREYRARQERGLKPKKVQLENFTIPPDLLEQMREWHAQRVGKFVLDNTKPLYKRFKTLCKKAGFPEGTRHLTRHTVMTELLDSGVNPALLPHSHGISKEVAAKSYYHPTEATIADVQTRRRTPKLKVVA